MNKNLKLNSVDWKEFKLNDLFDRIEKGKCKNTNEETKQSINGVSFLSATLNNNGVSGFVEPNSLLQKGNCIMFVNQGDGGAGYSVYKKEDFISTTSNSFGYAKWINKYTGLFVASILCRFKEKYSFGYGRTENRLKNDKVFIPINSKGQPHWEFMENYMMQIEEKQIQKVINYYASKVQNLQNNIIIAKDKNLNTIEWKEFKISDLFTVFTGGDLILSNIDNGKIPIISHSMINNGIATWTEEIKGRKLFNHKYTISLADRGNFFATTQRYDFYIGTRVKALESKNKKIDYLALLFISLCINKQSVRFSYGKNCCGNTNSMRIMLPIDSKGEPHWEFMENFMRKIEYKKLNIYLDYIKNKTATN